MHDDRTPDERSLVPSEPTVSSEENTYAIVTEKGKPKTLLWSLLSLILGILSVCLSIFGWVGSIIGASAIIFSIIGRKGLGYFSGMTVVGLLTGIFGIVFGAAMTVASQILPNFNIL